jgi:hypothetical protein
MPSIKLYYFGLSQEQSEDRQQEGIRIPCQTKFYVIVSWCWQQHAHQMAEYPSACSEAGPNHCFSSLSYIWHELIWHQQGSPPRFANFVFYTQSRVVNPAERT